MLNYIFWRLVSTIPVMLFVAIFIFALLRLAPGDPVALIIGEQAKPEEIERVRIAFGLDRPIYEQFWLWISSLVQGDLGNSLVSKVPIKTLIAQRLEATLSLASTTIVTSLLIALPLGIFAAWNKDRIIDRFSMIIAVLGFSTPAFLIGYFLIYIFSMKLSWLPVQGYQPLAAGLSVWLKHLILPTMALSFTYIALIARTTRASMLEVLDEDYIRTAESKGLGVNAVLFRHALRNAAVPISTIVGIGIAGLISGVVITETVFNIPGLGRLTVDAVMGRDYPVIQVLILMFSLVYVLINLLIDIGYVIIDPRISYN